MVREQAKTMRGFVGIKVPLLNSLRPLREKLGQLASENNFTLRLIAEENLHITLKFLGKVERNQLAELKVLLARLARQSDAIEIDLQSTGLFKNSFWVGIEENQKLNQLAASLDKAAALLGFARESKVFIPHITLARFDKNAQGQVRQFSNKFAGCSAGTVYADAINLYQSETRHDGASYSILYSEQLGKKLVKNP